MLLIIMMMRMILIVIMHICGGGKGAQIFHIIYDAPDFVNEIGDDCIAYNSISITFRCHLLYICEKNSF